MIYKESYDAALNLLRGNAFLPPIFQELKSFVQTKYNIKVSGFLFEHVDFLIEKPYRLHVLLLSKKDQDKMMLNNPKIYGFDSEKQDSVLNKLKELNFNYSFLEKNMLENCIVVFAYLGKDIIEDINQKTIKKADEFIKNKFKEMDIWLVDSLFEVVYVFFKTNKELNTYIDNGELETIKKSYLSFIKPYDEFGVYQVNDVSMQFTSKEIIDKDYDGEIYNYFRCV